MALSTAGTATNAVDALAASGGVNVDLDLTFVVQVVLFVGLFLVLKPLLFTPLLKLFEERERRIEGAKNEARGMFAEADAMMAKYEEELVEVRRTAGAERDKLRVEGQKKEQAILSKVREQTNAMVDEGKAKIAKDGAALSAELATSAQTLAREMASRVLGREV